MKTVRHFFVILSLAVSMQAWSATFVDGVWYNFNIEEKTAEVTNNGNAYTDYIGNIVIPSIVTYDETDYRVTSVGDNAFKGAAWLGSVIIPFGVISIGDQAFCNCGYSSSTNIPSSVIRIGSRAFEGCFNISVDSLNSSLTSIGGTFNSTIWYDDQPDGLVYINKMLYGYKGIMPANTVIDVPDGVVSIANKAFLGCSTNLISITIPNSVISIGDDVFLACNSLASINVESGNINYSSENGVLFDKNKTSLIYYPGGKTGDYIIPASVASIGYSAFSDCGSLTSIVIPSNVTSIGDYAFFNCGSLTSITNLNTTPVNTSSSVFGFSGSSGVNRKNCMIIVPTSAVSDYQNTGAWNEFNIMGGGILVYPTVNNIKYGYVIGNDLYEENEIATVTAIANHGYKFVNWTKEGEVVSTENSYSFEVIEDVELVANFVSTYDIEDDILILPSDSGAFIVWSPNEDAEGYILTIYTDKAHTDPVCALEFDATGKLTKVTMLKSGSETQNFACTVENLSSGTTYYYTLETFGADNAPLASLSGDFTTTGGEMTGVVETQCITPLPGITAYYSISGIKLPKEPASGVYIIKYDDGTAIKVFRTK